MLEFFGKIVLRDEFFTLILEYSQPCIENISKRTKVHLAGQKLKAKAQAVGFGFWLVFRCFGA